MVIHRKSLKSIECPSIFLELHHRQVAPTLPSRLQLMTMKQLSVPKPQISSRRDVDDGLKSVASVEEAVELANDIQEMCKRGGFFGTSVTV